MSVVRSNQQVDADALRRPRAAHAPGASRRSHARYAARGPGCQWAEAGTILMGKHHGLTVCRPSVGASGRLVFRASVRRVVRSSASRKGLVVSGAAP